MKDDISATLDRLIEHVEASGAQKSDGEWLEQATIDAGPLLTDWDVAQCFAWDSWPDRDIHFPATSKVDIGIDVVAVRRSDGKHIAVQCKSRKLDELGGGNELGKRELDSFGHTSAGSFWHERWVVTHGSVPLGRRVREALSAQDSPLKLVHLTRDLRDERGARSSVETEAGCDHCEVESSSAPPPQFRNAEAAAPLQTKSCMQREAVRESVRLLREHEDSASGGLPVGQARGKIILPCGTGKTRISLRIVEELTPSGGLSVVLCPSIALVAQIRREYRWNAGRDLRVLAVCSDKSAGYDPKGEDKRAQGEKATDPIADASYVSETEVKGRVTTDPREIADWIASDDGQGAVNVIFGTYQSGHRVAEALKQVDAQISVLVADEAHRTAGLPRASKGTEAEKKAADKHARNFSLCHDNDAFPARYRVYQTATPRVYQVNGAKSQQKDMPADWIVRSMDDETIFGVNLFRRSYRQAVHHGWLADYRIIAVGINDRLAYERANMLAGTGSGSGRNRPTTSDYLKGLAFAMAMGGATDAGGDDDVSIKSCIAFLNTVKKSETMAKELRDPEVLEWLQAWLDANTTGNRQAVKYSLEHVDARSNVTKRDQARVNLEAASFGESDPHAVFNVGIFGEGTDSPALTAVAFLESRKSPIDVIQAVGRAMRTAPDKDFGYIVVPIMIPPNADPEKWLQASGPDDWRELGQILQALRAHDGRIEDELESLLHIYLPVPPKLVHTYVAVGTEDHRVRHYIHTGPPDSVVDDLRRTLAGAPTTGDLSPISVAVGESAGMDDEPNVVMTARRTSDGSVEVRTGPIKRNKPRKDETHGRVDYDATRKLATEILNRKDGDPIAGDDPKAGVETNGGGDGHGGETDPTDGTSKGDDDKDEDDKARGDTDKQSVFEPFKKLNWDKNSNAIKMNLLRRSGLSSDHVTRDLNILEESIQEAKLHLAEDELKPILDKHFELDNLKDGKQRADGPTIAALLWMNAAMLHQRIANQGWLDDVEDLESVSGAREVVEELKWQWNQIIGQDFETVLQPALNAIRAVERTGKTAGLERALRHLASKAAEIAETYADMGADHAGALFNRVMGDQSSDGAYFTRPVAASLLARLALDAAEPIDTDWTNPDTWRRNRTVDLACGSGTLLAALLTDMKRRAKLQGADKFLLADLHKLAVEETLKGMDINDIALQLAASRLTTGERDIAFQRMGLHKMRYGTSSRRTAQVAAGSLELLGQSAIVGRGRKMPMPDSDVGSSTVWRPGSRAKSARKDDPKLENAVAAAKDARIVIMNPPFTNRVNMGEKFPPDVQRKLRERVDALREQLAATDPEMAGIGDKNSIEPLFVALAERCSPQDRGIVALVNPTIAMSAPSAIGKRQVLADRFRIHTVLTCHDPRQPNLSESTINESLIIAKRGDGSNSPTRFISLDRFPTKESEVDELHACIQQSPGGMLARGWGEISFWDADRISDGDWTPAIWRAPALAEAGYGFANCGTMPSLGESRLLPVRTDLGPATGFNKVASPRSGCITGLNSSGKGGQNRIESRPDQHWIPVGNPPQAVSGGSDGGGSVHPIMRKAGHLLITSGQNAKSARLTAVAGDERYVGNGWLPVPNATLTQAKALAVFFNSTPGRVQLMRNAGRTLGWPQYNPAVPRSVRIPDPTDDHKMRTLANCWEQTKDTLVPQFGDGECDVRRIWDDAVADAMGWDPDELTRLRLLLHREPHVSGRRYGHYGD